MYWLVSSFFMAGKLPTITSKNVSSVAYANAINHCKKGLLGMVEFIGFTTSMFIQV
jgi:hypothetical protein